MSWASENKFLAGFGAVMVAGVGVLGYLTWSAMGKYDEATVNFDSAVQGLKTLQDTKPALTDKQLKELLAQKQSLTEKIGDLQKELRTRVLPIEPIKKEAFQDKLKETVAQIAAKSAEVKIERPKDFYMGFGEYQSKPPDDKAAPALARQLRAIELAMGVLIKTGNLDLDELHRDPLPEEGKVKPGDAQPDTGDKKPPGGGSERGAIERNGIRLKITSTDEALRKILTEFANHKEQLFVIRKVSVQNKQTESPPRLIAAPPPPAAAAVPDASAPPAPPALPAPPAPGAATPPPAPAPAPGLDPAALAPKAEGSLAYVFGTEKIVSTIELELLNIEEPKAHSEKPDKGGKKKEK